MTETEIITYKQFDMAVRRVFNKNMKERHTSFCEPTIARRANDFIVDIREGEKTMCMIVGWRDALKVETDENL